MAILGVVLVLAGILGSLVGGIWFLVAAFRESILWGLGSLCVPFVSLIFLIAYWNDAKNPFLVQIGSSLIIIIGIVLMAIGADPTTVTTSP